MRTWLAALALVWMAAQSAQAQIWGAGSISCGKVISDLVKLENGEPHIDFTYGQWVMGFITGSAMSLPPGERPYENLDADGVNLWVIKRCRENPLDDLATTAMNLLAETLAKRAKPKKK